MDYNSHCHEMSLRFCIDADAAIGTLEGALAIVRRGGVELRKLRAGLGTHGLEVWMHLAAMEADALMLCTTRMQQVIGLTDLKEVTNGFESIADAKPCLRSALG